MTHPFTRRDWLLVAAFALIAALVMVYALNPRPSYLDSYYHYNAAARWASGDGLTDTALWVYLGLPEGLPEPITETPSHLYWMPMTSLLAGASMKLFGLGYAVAQLPMALCYAGAILLSALAGGWLGGAKRHAALAMLLMVASSSFAPMWGETDTFAPYALFGAGALAAMIQARGTDNWRWWLAAGLLSGAGHLTRSDGLLLLMVGVLVALLSARRSRTAGLAAVVIGYLLVMGPWFVRMIGVVGAPLPVGGLQTAYLTEYEQIFRYPWQELSLGSAGVSALVQARIETFPKNIGTFFVSEGWLVLWPLMLWGLFRVHPAARLTVGLFALALHVAMSLVFAWPAARGGLFHGASALMPWWSALTIIGGEAFIDRLTRRQPRMRRFTQVLVLGIIIAAAFWMTSFTVSTPKPASEPQSVTVLRPYLTAGDRVMATDPALNYYHLGVGGVVLPDTPVARLEAMAETFDLDYFVLEGIIEQPDGTLDPIAPVSLKGILNETPAFLQLVEDFGHTRLYRFVRQPEDRNGGDG
jgi:4-amino-4-deoxy-L-arabinose transferase-like glycosyltransferase